MGDIFHQSFEEDVHNTACAVNIIAHTIAWCNGAEVRAKAWAGIKMVNGPQGFLPNISGTMAGPTLLSQADFTGQAKHASGRGPRNSVTLSV